MALSVVQEEIGARIKWARELVQPNRSEFARILGVDRTTIQKIEDGERAPSVFNVIDFANRLRLSTDYILRGSMLGVDAELAEALVRRHPELLAVPRSRASAGIQDTGTVSGTSRPPRKPTDSAA